MSREAHVRFCESVAVRSRRATRPPMERLFRSLKTEWIPRHGYRSFQETIHDVGEYVMSSYNRERVHSYNKYVTPEMQEHRWQPPKPVSINT